jgi:hypothetical protein
MRTQPISRAGWRLPSVRLRAVSGRLLRRISQRKWLSSRLLARTVGPLPQHALSWPVAQRLLEITKRCRAAGRKGRFEISSNRHSAACNSS